MSYDRMWCDFKQVLQQNSALIQRYIDAPWFERQRLQGAMQYQVAALPALVLHYPGYKTKPGLWQDYALCDYRVELDGAPVAHDTIANDLYQKAIACRQHAQWLTQLKVFLGDLASHGDSVRPDDFAYLNNLGGDFTVQQLCHLIPWIALQEDVNYPTWIGRLNGRRMAFYRYIEAVCIVQYPSVLNWSLVKERVNVSNKPPPAWVDTLDRAGEYDPYKALISPGNEQLGGRS